MKLKTHTIFALFLFTMSTMFSTLLWGNGTNAESIYNTNKHAQAIAGYDTVAYFTTGKPLKGNPALSHTWQDAIWIFANAEHLELFKAHPEQYAPQYGGYCAWAIAAKSKRFDIDPAIWKIVDDKLYLNYNKRIGKKWKKDTAAFIAKADLIWEKMTGIEE